MDWHNRKLGAQYQPSGSFPGTPLRSHSSQDASSSPSPSARTPLPSAAAQPPTPTHSLLSFTRDPSPLELLPGGPGPGHSHPPRKWPLPSRSQRALCWNHVFYHALNLGLHISCLPKHTSFFFLTYSFKRKCQGLPWRSSG